MVLVHFAWMAVDHLGPMIVRVRTRSAPECDDGGDAESRGEVAGQLVVARGETAEILEAAEHRLDPPAVAIAPLVEADFALAGAGAGNDHLNALLAQVLAQPVGIVALVGDQPAQRVPVPCFTADAFEAACRRHAIEHRKTRPYIPKTNGMVERFNGRVQREVLGIMIYSYQDLDILLAGFNVAYNVRRQRVLKGLSPEMVLHQRLKDKPALTRTAAKKADPAALDRALKVVAGAKEVSQPDS